MASLFTTSRVVFGEHFASCSPLPLYSFTWWWLYPEFVTPTWLLGVIHKNVKTPKTQQDLEFKVNNLWVWISQIRRKRKVVEESDKWVWFKFCTLKTSRTAMKGQIQCGFYSQKSDWNEIVFGVPSLFKYTWNCLYFMAMCEKCVQCCVCTQYKWAVHITLGKPQVNA